MAKKRAYKKRPLRLYEGLPVVDANEDQKLSVTKADVTGSSKKSPANCAAARTLSRELHTEARVFITRTYIKDKKAKRWVRYLTPNSIGREIVSFDRGSQFETGEYIIKAPSVGQRLGHYRGKSTELNTGAKRNKPLHRTVSVRGFDKGLLK